jgi:hypothetical protein
MVQQGIKVKSKMKLIIIISLSSLFLSGYSKKETIITGQITGKSDIELVYSVPLSGTNYFGFNGTLKVDEQGNFELKAKIVDEANFMSDIVLKSGKKMEYKSWKQSSFKRLLNGDQAKNQLKAYIQHGDFEYVVDAKKLLNDGVLDPGKFVKGEFQKVFKDNAKELFEQNPSFFKQFKGIDGKTIENLPAFEKLVKDESFVKQLSNIIKVE